MQASVSNAQELWESWWPPIFFSFDEASVPLFQGFIGSHNQSASVQQGSAIMGINEQAVVGIDPYQILEMLAGPENSTISIEFSGRAGASIELKREKSYRPVLPAATVRGLENPGNCCFLNAPLQCIAHTFPDMVHFVAGTRPPTASNNSGNTAWQFYKIASAFSQLAMGITVESGASKAQPIAAVRDALSVQIEEVLPDEKRRHQEQEDAHHLLVRLLDLVDSAMMTNPVSLPAAEVERRKTDEQQATIALRKAEMSVFQSYEEAVQILCSLQWDRDMKCRHLAMQQQMWGQYVKGIGCYKCRRWVEVRPEVYNMLELPIPAQASPRSGAVPRIRVMQCLDLFFDQENSRNNKDNALKCPGCNKSGEVLQKYSLIRIPSNLIIVLKRYTFESASNGIKISKNQAVIEPAEVLDLREHIFGSGNNGHSGGVGGGTMYELGSICVHIGSSPRSGHYIALVKLRNVWWRVSDDKVRECNDNDWQEAQRNCYILFYKKRT